MLKKINKEIELFHFLCNDCFDELDIKVVKTGILDIKGNKRKVKETCEVNFTCNFCDQFHSCIIDFIKFKLVEKKNSCCLIF